MHKVLIWFLKLTLLIFSPVQFSSPPPIQQLDFCDSSPLFLRRSSLTSSLDDEDDGFLEVLDDNMEVRPLSLAFMKRTHLLSLRIFQNGFWYIWNHSLPWENGDHTLTGFTESQNSYSLLFKLRSHMISLWWSVLYLSDDTALSPTEQLWDADGNGQLAHCPTGVWQRRRRLGESEFCSWNVYHLYFYKSILNVNGWWVKLYIFVSFSLWFAAGRGACSAPLPCPVRCPVPLSSVPTAPETKPRLSGWRGGAAWLEHTSPPWNKTLNPQEWSVFIPFLVGFIWWLLF